MNLKAHYDPEVDILYFARPGQEAQVVEVAPGLSLEYDDKGDLIGVEIMNASHLMKGIIEPLRDKAHAA